jgi:hypothetical protein
MFLADRKLKRIATMKETSEIKPRRHAGRPKGPARMRFSVFVKPEAVKWLGDHPALRIREVIEYISETEWARHRFFR